MNKKNFFVKEALQKKNFSEIINYVSKIYPKKVLFIQDKINLNYQDFNLKINQTCFFFKKKNIKKGEIISLYFDNSIEFIILYFACIRYGCIVSPIPHGVSKIKIKYYINLSKSKYLISNEKFKFSNVFNLVFKDYEGFNQKISKNSSDNFSTNIYSKKTCVYYFSSGTTSNPKLIKYSNYSMVNCQKILFKSNFLKIFSKHMCVLPLGHTASLRYSIKNAIVGAGTVFIFRNFWEVKDRFWSIIEKNKINFVGTVPSIIETIFYLYKKKKRKSKYLKFIGCGSSILKKEIQENFKNKFKIDIKNIYGMSEIGVATMDNPSLNNIYGSIGKQLKGVNVKLFNGKKKIIKKENIVGEICVKTPALFSGYIDKKIKHKKNMFINSFFRTGDLALIKNGNLKFVDRSKDIIIKGGVNISPQEIDECLQKNKDVLESATIGVADRFFGENIKSFVVLRKNKNLSSKKLYIFCKKNLGEFRSPTNIVFVNNLPKTPSGKVIKRMLKN
jgi:acyl-coenzyme A synthetase/AMP-(fatty) acid ligase